MLWVREIALKFLDWVLGLTFPTQLNKSFWRFTVYFSLGWYALILEGTNAVLARDKYSLKRVRKMKKIKSLMKLTVFALAMAFVGSFALSTESIAFSIIETVPTKNGITVYADDDRGNPVTFDLYLNYNDENRDGYITAGDTVEATSKGGAAKIGIADSWD